MNENNEYENIKISINIKDSAKRSLTEIHNKSNKIKIEDEEKNDNKAYSVNIFRDDSITKEELDGIRDFKAFCLHINFRYDSNIFTDLLVLRLLKSTNFSMKNTYKKLLNYIKFYNEYLIYDIKISDFPNIDKIKLFYPHGFHKTTIIGEPILIQMLDQLKINEINKILKEPLLTKYILYIINDLEKNIFPKCSTYYERKIDKIFCIIDLMGLTTSLMSKEIYNFIKKQINIVSDIFCGILGSLYFINTGLIFRGIWSTCKYLYDYRTRNRIKLIGFQYKNDLLSKIDEKNLPKFFGGLCNCDPYGCLFSNEGPWNENKNIKEGDKRRSTNFLDIINKKKQNMEDNDNIDSDEEEEIEEKNNGEYLNENIINNQLSKIDEINGPNDINN